MKSFREHLKEELNTVNESKFDIKGAIRVIESLQKAAEKSKSKYSKAQINTSDYDMFKYEEGNLAGINKCLEVLREVK